MADAITVSNLRITPYSQKDSIAKIVYGDEWTITIKLPTPHVAGDKYAIGIDYQNTLYPPNRPLCAGSELYVLNGDELTFTLKLATARLRDWCSTLKKPMPIAIQIVRTRDGKAETLLLDSLLALPSVFDGVVTVYEGDSLDERLNEKMDNPPTEGEAGQVLGINEDGQIVWTTIEIPEQVQADWDESDSSSPSFIRNKPEATVVNDGKITINQGGIEKGTFTVNQAGDTVIDLNDGAQSDWDESDSSDVSFIKNKPALANVATSGSYNDLTNKPIITAPVNADWEESDSSDLAYIFNKPNLATVATSGSYNDLTDKPVIPEQEQADWDESDSSDVSFIKNKPALATVATTGSYNDLSNKPTIPDDQNDYLCFKSQRSNFQVKLTSYGSNLPINIEYSFDKVVWHTYTLDTYIVLENTDDVVYWRGNNDHFSSGNASGDYNRYYFSTQSNHIGVVSGNVMSLLDSTCKSTAIPTAWCFYMLFNGCGSCYFEGLKLPATTLKPHCYEGMFRSCGKLYHLPVCQMLNVEDSACKNMYQGCSQLKEVDLNEAFPFLTHIDMGQVTARDTFDGMFENCNNLQRVNFFSFQTIFEFSYNPYTNWLNNVKQTGVFECNASLNTSTRDASHVPAGWTIVRYNAPNADWSQTDTTEASYILNKPAIPTTSDINALIADALTIHNS